MCWLMLRAKFVRVERRQCWIGLRARSIREVGDRLC